MRLAVDHRTVDYASGPLLVLDRAPGLAYAEIVEVVAPDGAVRSGQVLEVDGDRAVVQVFGGTAGLDRPTTVVRARGETARIGVGRDLVGRILDGAGRPLDGGPPPAVVEHRPLAGAPLNPVSRAHPDQFIETGISAVDGLNTLVRGQKLPIFSGFGLPAAELAARIVEQARVPEDDAEFVVVFAAMGVTRREAEFFRSRFAAGPALERSVLFLNLAEDPTTERLFTPRAALTVAEHLAFDEDMHVLVVLTDMTNYCEALREVSAAREEMPGRRGYPGYMYTDLSSLYERAGRVRGRPGSVTQLMIVSMPDDDITHPVPDLTGYITEGQIVLSRELDRQGIDPPIDILPSLSRLMNSGIGAGRTRAEHRPLADQVYACYARGREVRRLVAVVGEAALPAEDRLFLSFADDVERRFVGQGAARRTIGETLDLAWELLSRFPDERLTRIPPDLLAGLRGQAPSGQESGQAPPPPAD